MAKGNNVQLAGLSIDDWLDKETLDTQLEETQEESTLKYDKKLVAFLDLLGITHLIKTKIDGQEREVIAQMEKIKGIVEIESKEYIEADDLNLLHISDSFIFACSPNSLPRLLDLLSIVQMRILIECRILLRGALEYGNVIVKDDGRQIIGPAYIDAYVSQEHDAIYPRIIISNAVRDLIKNQFPGYSNVVMTYDRENSLDYITTYIKREGNKKSIISRLKREGIFDFLMDEYKKYNSLNNPSVRRKFGWTINYFREKGVWPDGAKYNNWQ